MIKAQRDSTSYLSLSSPIYEIDRHRPPLLTISPGQTVVVETEDAFTHQISKPGDYRDRSVVPYSNPVTGPIAVEGAEAGDTLRIRIERIEPLDGRCATYAPAHALVLGHLGAEVDDQ